MPDRARGHCLRTGRSANRPEVRRQRCTPASSALLTSREHGHDASEVQDDVRRLVTAVFIADFETTLNYTHPQLISALGGRDAALRQMTALGLSEKLGQMKVEELAFPSPPNFLTGNENEFVIVPVRISTSLNNRRGQSTNFQLGARPIGTAKWGYLDGKKIDRALLLRFFPDFPPNYELPNANQNATPQ